jgi:hypothetical protein
MPGGSIVNKPTVRSHEYKNDFLYIVIRQVPEYGPEAYAYCCGINISRFDPICWGKAGICSNPAFKGLQLLRANVSAFAQKKRARTQNAVHIPCAPMTPRGDGWYRESTLLIQDASPKVMQEILEFSVMDLVKTVLAVCAPEAKVPAKMPNPPEMQKYLESMSIQNYKQAAPAPIAKPVR